MRNAPTRWPWISLIVSALAAVSGVGREFVDAAFISSDPLGRNIAQPIVLIAMAVMLVAVLGEFMLRNWIRARRTKP